MLRIIWEIFLRYQLCLLCNDYWLHEKLSPGACANRARARTQLLSRPRSWTSPGSRSLWTVTFCFSKHVESNITSQILGMFQRGPHFRGMSFLRLVGRRERAMQPGEEWVDNHIFCCTSIVTPFIQPPTVDCGDRKEPPLTETCDSCESGFDGKCPCPWGYFADPYDCDQYHYCQGTADPLEYGCSNATFDGLYNADMIQVCTSINNLTFKR